jgi:hypothetical protein
MATAPEYVLPMSLGFEANLFKCGMTLQAILLTTLTHDSKPSLARRVCDLLTSSEGIRLTYFLPQRLFYLLFKL